MKPIRSGLVGLLLVAGCVLNSSIAQAAIIVTNNTNANDLASALALGGGITITSSKLSEYQTILNTAASTGTYTLTGPLPDTYGLMHGGIVLSTGNAAYYNTGPVGNPVVNYNTATTKYDSILDPITTPFGWGGYAHHDVTKLDITFDMQAGKDTVYFELVFGSHQSPPPDFFYDDAFVALLNGTNIALTGSDPLTVKNPNMLQSALVTNPGTALSWLIAPGGAPVLAISAKVAPGSIGNTLSFLISDTNDGLADSTVFISGLRGNSTIPVPEPASWALAGLGLALVLCRARRQQGR